MAQIDLHCRECEHGFTVTTHGAIKEEQKRCPKCGSSSLRQTLSSYLRNGSLADSACGAPVRRGFG